MAAIGNDLKYIVEDKITSTFEEVLQEQIRFPEAVEVYENMYVNYYIE